MTSINININVTHTPPSNQGLERANWETPLALGQVWQIAAPEVFKEHVIRMIVGLTDNHVVYEYATLNAQEKLVVHKYTKRCLIASFDKWRATTKATLKEVVEVKRSPLEDAHDVMKGMFNFFG